MSETQTKAAAGQAPAAEMKQALSGFLSDFRGFQDDVKSRLQQQEERLIMLDRKSQFATTANARPALSRSADIEAPHQKAFGAYLRTGDDDGLRGLEIEGKAMSSAVAGDGGYLVDPQTADTIKSVLKSTASIRAIAQVVTVEATSYDVLVDHSDIGSGWASETANQVETDTPQIERVTIPLHELSAMPKASQRLLDDSAFDIEGWLASRIADKFSRAEAAAFINGDGVDKPKGILTHPQVDDSLWAWGSLGYVATGTDGDFALGRGVGPGLCAGGGISRQCQLYHELENRRCGAQDEGRRWPVPVVRRSGGGRACTAAGLSGADRRGHARHRLGGRGGRVR